MCAPSTTWRFMTSNSSFSSLPGLFSTSSGVCTLPMSWHQRREPELAQQRPVQMSARACAIESAATLTMCVNV